MEQLLKMDYTFSGGSSQSTNTPRTISTSTCWAQSTASRFRRNVLHFVGQPERRTTAFHLPAGVLTMVATGSFAIWHCTYSVSAQDSRKSDSCYLIDNKRELVARGRAVRAANYDAEGARRVRIGRSRSESIERSSQLLVADTKRPLHGVFWFLVARGRIELPTRGFSVRL